MPTNLYDSDSFWWHLKQCAWNDRNTNNKRQPNIKKLETKQLSRDENIDWFDYNMNSGYVDENDKKNPTQTKLVCRMN